MALDPFSRIAIAEIVFYIPIFCIAFSLALKHGFTYREGWLYIFSFTIIRLVGAAMTIASRTESNPTLGLSVAAVIFQGIGLAPLILATLGFVMKTAEHGMGIPLITRPLSLIRALVVVGLILSVTGGSIATPKAQPSTVSKGRTLTRVGIVLFLVAYVFILAAHVALWRKRHHVPTHHRMLFSGVSLALPPLFVRVVYALLGAFASSPKSRWSPAFGDWKIYLVMGLILEYLSLCIYVITGTVAPLGKEEEVKSEGSEVETEKGSV